MHNKYQSNNIGGEDIVYKNELGILKKILGENNVFSYEISNDDINKFKLFFDIWFSFKNYREIKKIVKKNQIDLVHVHNFYPLLSPSVFKAAKDAGAKVVHTLHNYRLWCISGIFYRDNHGICELCTRHKFSLAGILNRCYRKSLIQSILAQFSFWFYRGTKIFNSIDYFFVLTKFQKDKIQDLGINENRIILKPNGIEKNHNGNQKEKTGYVYVGRLEESKGIYELLDIWTQLDDKFVLTVIGGSNEESDLRKKYTRANIIFKGKCSRADTLNYISQAKYLIQPSIWYETFGLTIIEAMSFGIPVIGLAIGTRSDFIEDELNGFLSPVGCLKTTIEKSYDYKNYQLLSNAASIKAKEFESGYIAVKQIELYKKIIGDEIV